MRRVGLLGCGAIGSRIARACEEEGFPAEVAEVYDRDAAASGRLAASLAGGPRVAENAHMLCSGRADIIVEAASQEAVREAALSALQNRKDLVVMSAGALLDPAVFEVLDDACREFGRSVYVPSGAVAGLDALKAARGELDSVTLVTTKPPAALAGAPHLERAGVDCASITSRTVVFEGGPAEAVRGFPANVNVAALVSLAGLGAATRVRVVADPAASSNSHRIEASGGFGEMSVELRNAPDPSNPRTSRLAALSAVRALRQACSGGVRVGT